MFVRILLVAAVVLVAVLVLRRARALAAGSRKPPAIAAKMVRCERCGTYFPRGEGARRHGLDYCSEAHAREDAAS